MGRRKYSIASASHNVANPIMECPAYGARSGRPWNWAFGCAGPGDIGGAKRVIGRMGSHGAQPFWAWPPSRIVVGDDSSEEAKEAGEVVVAMAATLGAGVSLGEGVPPVPGLLGS